MSWEGESGETDSFAIDNLMCEKRGWGQWGQLKHILLGCLYLKMMQRALVRTKAKKVAPLRAARRESILLAVGA